MVSIFDAHAGKLAKEVAAVLKTKEELTPPYGPNLLKLEFTKKNHHNKKTGGTYVQLQY